MASSSEAKDKGEGGFGDIIRVVVEAIAIALIVRTLLFQPFNIPSGSLVPTLLVGDYLFVSKYSYGYSRYSIASKKTFFDIGTDALASVFPDKGRVFESLPKRGDIAVFKLPKDNTTDYIKRVIGLPGDRVQMINGRLHINGQEVERQHIGAFAPSEVDPLGRDNKAPLFKEKLPNGVVHEIIEKDGDKGYWDNTREYLVPAGHYFMMGDNRDNSTDSRDLGSVGFVPLENFVGRAEIIFFSMEEGASLFNVTKWPTSIRWNRLFKVIR